MVDVVKVGLREANMHFSKHVKMVKEGSGVILSERGKPVAIIKPVPQQENTQEEQGRLLEEQGILRRAESAQFPLHDLISVSGKPLSEIVSESRESRL
jgi:antitoxin (DNA-binding transcriptional repressor) of toxin-antitoxin stability system